MKNSCRTENYEVLKSDRKIRHGHYQQILNGHILEDGYYKNGLKDSLWQDYNLNGSLISTGMYKEDQQVGNWNFYNAMGLLEQTYDFTNQKLLYYLPEKQGEEQKYNILINNENQEVILDRPPLYIEGTEAVRKKFTFNMKIPFEVYESGKSGKVVIRLSINEKGEVTDYEIKQSFGYGLDEEVLRVVKTLTHWLPAIYQGKEIATKINIPFNFMMSTGTH